MKAIFIELPAFERHRENYLDDDAFSGLQEALMGNPEAATAGRPGVTDLSPKQRAELVERVKGELKAGRSA